MNLVTIVNGDVDRKPRIEFWPCFKEKERINRAVGSSLPNKKYVVFGTTVISVTSAAIIIIIIITFVCVCV